MLADFKDSSGLWVRSYGGRSDPKKTKSGSVWSNMMQRCKLGGRYQRQYPTYSGCAASPLFSDFQTFTDWHTAQVGYGLEGYDLDKDLVGCGKLYSEETCVLIPHRLNTFFKSTQAVGVYKDLRRNNYYSNITVEGKAKRLGTFTTEEEAAAAFKLAKRAETLAWYHKLKAGVYKVDSKVLNGIIVLLDKEEN